MSVLTRTLPGMTELTYTFRSRNADGTYNETDGLTSVQAAKLGNGKPVTWTVANEQMVVDDDGTITYRETAG